MRDINKMIESVELRKKCTKQGIATIFKIMDGLTQKTQIEAGLFVRTDDHINCQHDYSDDVRIVVSNGEFCLVDFNWDDPCNSQKITEDEILWIDFKQFIKNLKDLVERLGKISTQQEELKILEKILEVI